MSLQAGQQLSNAHLMQKKKKKNRYDYYRGIDCIEKLWEKLKDQAIKIINYEKKK